MLLIREALMVAAHAWDFAGAKSVGLQTAFVHRPNTALYPNIFRPDYAVENLQEVDRTARLILPGNSCGQTSH